MPDLPNNITNFPNIVDNCEELNADAKTQVPDKTYLLTLKFVNITDQKKLENEISDASQPKHGVGGW